MTLHEILYSLELGKGKAWMNTAFVTLAIGALSLWYLLSEFHGFKEREAMDSAQIGRQIAEGKGFTTQWIRPQAVTLFESQLKAKSENKFEQFPEIYQAPLYPYLLGGLFSVTGKPYLVKTESLRDSPFRAEWVVCFLNIIFTYLTAFTLLILGVRLFDGRVGLLSAALFLVSDLTWRFAISGLSTTFAIFLLTLFWLFYNESMTAEGKGFKLKSMTMAGFSGVILALAILTRLSLAWILIPIGLLMVISFRRNLSIMLVFFIFCFAVVLPWLFHLEKTTGSCWGGWGVHFSIADSEFRSLQIGDRLSPLKAILIHIVQSLIHTLQNLQGLLGGSFVAMLAFAAIFHVFRRERARILQYGIFLILPFLVFAGSFVEPYPQWTSVWNMVVMILPLIILCGTAFFYLLLDRLETGIPLVPKMIVVFFIMLNAIPLLLTLAPPRELPFRFPPYYPPMIKLATEWSNKHEIIVSDMPWATSWYGDRISLWLPGKLKDLLWIHDYLQPISAMLITPVTFNQKISDLKSPDLVDYEKIVTRTGIPSGFPLSQIVALPPKNEAGQEVYLYLSDRPRWNEQK